MVFNCKFQFKRIFTNAKTPEQVLEILEDEDILIELRQECKRVRGGNVIAQYEEVARRFLFPAESNIPKQDQLKRDVLLTKTRLFNGGKGLNPQITFKTKTIIEAEEFDRNLHISPHISKKLPYVAYQDSSYVPPTIAKLKSPPKKYRNSHSDVFSKSLPVYNTEVDRKTKKLNSTTTEMKDEVKHCVCECPNADGMDIDEFASFYEQRLVDKNLAKPFRTGKDPENLISKRSFKDDPNGEENPIEKKRFKGFCRSCKIPLKTCVLCNAYKAVYGCEKFLTHRLQQKKSNSILKDSSGNSTKKSAKKSSTIDVNPTNPVSSTIGKPDALFENVPMSTPFTKKTLGSPRDIVPPISMIASSDSDDDVILQGEEVCKDHTSKLPLFHSRGRYYRTVHATESFSKESQRIHDRIKELMKKNESVLQYELSSSESEDLVSDDDDIRKSLSRLTIDEPPNSTSSRKSLPARSIVTPSGGSPYWGVEYDSQIGRTRRDVFDSSLRHHYKELYEETSGSKHLQ